MAPGTYDYEVEGGDCLPLSVVLKDGNDTGLTLTGYLSTFVLTWGDESLTLHSGGRLDMAEAGESPMDAGAIQGEITGAETSALPYGRIARYEWSVTAPGGCKTTFLKGYITRT